MQIKNRYTSEVIFKGTVDHLKGADLRCADLKGADLRYADLKGTDLRYANLRDANLEDANLEGADLRGADLRCANLQEANLEDADLRYANLQEANLEDADLEGAYHILTPASGEFYAYKKLSNNVIIKVLIPADAERLTPIGSRKCRASYVKVVEVLQGEITAPIKSTNYGGAMYYLGAEVHADSFDSDIRKVCTNGIHFFMTYEEAEDWS